MTRITLPTILGGIYLLSEIALVIWRRSKTEGKSKDRNSLALLWIIIFASLYAGIWTAEACPAASLPHRELLVIIGAAVFVVGIVFRWWAIAVLGKFFTVDVAISHEHHVVDTGPYRFVRHPSYTGALMAFAGFGLCLGSWVSILCVMIPITAAFLWRIRIEERALIAALGEEYLNYSRKTKRLIPFLL